MQISKSLGPDSMFLCTDLHQQKQLPGRFASPILNSCSSGKVGYARNQPVATTQIGDPRVADSRQCL